MLLENPDEKEHAGGDLNGQGSTPNDGNGLERVTSDTASISSVIMDPQPVDRMSQLEQSNHRIEAMLQNLMNGGGSPLSTIGSSTAPGSITSPNHRKFSTEQTLHEDSLHGQDHVQPVTSRGSQYSSHQQMFGHN